MSTTAMAPEGRGATRERIASLLRDEILDGRLGPGVPLRTGDVMARLGVSNSPLREAFVQLEAEGLVEVNRNRGVVVAPLTRDGASDLIRIGSLLWDAGIRWIVPVLEQATVESLRNVNTDFELALRSGDVSNAILDGEHFMSLLLESCWSTELVRAIQAVRPRLQRLDRIFSDVTVLERSDAVQRGIIAAAGSTDVDGVSTAFRDYWRALNDSVEKNPRVPA